MLVCARAHTHIYEYKHRTHAITKNISELMVLIKTSGSVVGIATG
jgi:hypothetical protein